MMHERKKIPSHSHKTLLQKEDLGIYSGISDCLEHSDHNAGDVDYAAGEVREISTHFCHDAGFAINTKYWESELTTAAALCKEAS